MPAPTDQPDIPAEYAEFVSQLQDTNGGKVIDAKSKRWAARYAATAAPEADNSIAPRKNNE